MPLSPTATNAGWREPSSSPPSDASAPHRTRWSALSSSTPRAVSPGRATTPSSAGRTPRWRHSPRPAADARGGTLYVTLEPCAHHGKTPPCTDAVLAAGVSRVVVALTEPTQTAGGGIDRLRAEGVEVQEGPGSERSRILNRRWLRWARFHRPWVTLKSAVSLDGRIATRTGDSKWITGEEARHRGLELREEHDAILVGVETILADDPQLTRRLGLNPAGGWRRIILDSTLRTPSDARVVQHDPEIDPHRPHLHWPRPEDRRRLRESGVELVELRAGDDGRIDLEALLDHLARKEVAALLVEGGPTVHGSFHDADLIDEIAMFVAPFLIGGPAPAMRGGAGNPDPRHGASFSLRSLRAARIRPRNTGHSVGGRRCSPG